MSREHRNIEALARLFYSPTYFSLPLALDKDGSQDATHAPSDADLLRVEQPLATLLYECAACHDPARHVAASQELL